jgi:sporulation protein YlmC with PRC-barrel domain
MTQSSQLKEETVHMDLHFGCDVRGRDGTTLGTLQGAIHDPTTDQVVSLLVQHDAPDARTVSTPVGSITAADGTVVELEFDGEQFSELPDYAVDEHNIAPPPVADNLEGQDELEPDDVPDVPAVGAATGIESIAFTPVIEEDVDLPAGDQVLSRETVVQALDGEIGNLSDLVLDDQTRRIQEFVIRRGVIFANDVTVPRDWAVTVGTETITLSVDQERVRQLPEG